MNCLTVPGGVTFKFASAVNATDQVVGVINAVEAGRTVAFLLTPNP